MTRQQRYLTTALKHVNDVKNANNKPMADIYGGLCHSFPVLVRTCGLCQALAFVDAKAGDGERGQAYSHLHRHVAAELGITNAQELLNVVGAAGVADYMRHTRTVLRAWVYYKRFAVSILKVQTASRDDEHAVVS